MRGRLLRYWGRFDSRMCYGRGFPQFLQNLPSLTVPQPHVHDAAASGFALPQLGQNLPLFTAPQEQVHSSGFALPQLEQNLPVFFVPHAHNQPAAAAAAAAAAACCWAI